MIGANLASAVGQLAAYRGRSLLTAAGIGIAVAATMSVVGVVGGLTDYVSTFLRGFGTNAMWVWPERPEGAAGRSLGRVELDARDVAAVADGCPALARVSPLVRLNAAAIRGGNGSATTALEGVAEGYPTIRNFAVDAGRPLTATDVAQGHRVCVVGRDVLRKLGVGDELVDRPLAIDGHRFRVVGVLRAKGSFFGISQDDLVLVPYTTALAMYPAMERGLAIAARAADESRVPEARAQVVNLLRRRHGLDVSQPNDFQVRTQDEVLATFERASMAASAVLVLIVGISLLVGGIGIMNVMLVGVTERTREIGLRKAVGARRRDILAQFLAEAVGLSVLGGGMGIAAGYGLTTLASLHPRMVDVVVPGWAAGLGFGFSFAVGVIFGLLPAIKAALLHPIDALRHD